MMKKVVLTAITLYQKTLSPDHGIVGQYLFSPTMRCRFYPSCSEYMRQSIERDGVMRGSMRGAKRLLRCRPSNRGGHDPVEIQR